MQKKIIKILNTLLKSTIIFFFCAILGSYSLYGQGHIKELKSGERNFEKLRTAFYTDWEGNGSSYRELKRFKRWEDMMVPRLQNGLIPGADYYLRKSEIYKQEITKAASRVNPDNPWTAIGPMEWEVAEGGYNPGNGRINCISVDPNDKEIIYVGAASGGFWKTTDGGESWSTSTDDLGSLGITDIYVNPDNTSEITILTGDAYGNDTPSIGLYKSLDSGESWSATNFAVDRNSFNTYFKLEVGKLNKDLMLVGGDGIHRSDDNGETWTQVSNSVVSDLIFHPNNEDIIYACTSSENSQNTITILKSTNKGITWEQKEFAFPDLNKRLGRKALAITSDNSEVLYVLATAGNGTYGGLFKSEDMGESFTLKSSSPNIFGYQLDASDNIGQGWYDLAIVANPENENEIYVSGIHIWKSNNSGEDWELQNYWQWGETDLPYVHADNHTLDFYHGDLYAGGDGGIFYSEDDAQSFENLSFGLNIAQFYRIGLHPTDENIVIGGLQDNGSFTLYDNTWYHIFGADGMDALIDHTDPSTVFSEYQNGGIIRYNNHGLEIDLFIENEGNERGGWITPFIMHPSDNQIMFFGYENVWRSDDQGNNLRKISDFDDNNVIQVLKISKSYPSDLLVVRAGMLYISTDNGTTWMNKTSGLPAASLQDAIFDVNDELTLWSTFGSGEVYQSTNLGNSWTSMSDGLPDGLSANTITQHSCGNILYVGTDIGVYQYDLNNDEGWIYMENQLPNVIVRELEIQESTNKLFAGTYGRGVWKIDIPAKATGITPQTVSITAIDDKQFNDEPFTIEATASSDLPVTIISKNEDILSIEGNSAQIEGVGTVLIAAVQGGNCTYATSDTSFYSLTIGKSSQEIDFEPLSDDLRIIKGEEFTLTATSTSSLPVTFTSSDEGLISIEGNIAKVANIADGGTVTITASQSGNDFYEAAESVTQEQVVLILSGAEVFAPLTLSPNPANNLVKLPNELNQMVTYKIYSLNGALAKRGITNYKIDVRALNPDTYVLVVEGENYKFIKK